MLVGVGDPAVILFLEGVHVRAGIGIAACPERLDELLALFVGLQAEEGFSLGGRNDVGDLVQPLLVGVDEFLHQFFFPLLLLSFAEVLTVVL